MSASNTSGVVSVSRDVDSVYFRSLSSQFDSSFRKKALIMIFQPRNPVAFLPGSDAYMDNWCDIKCRKGPNGN